MHVSVRVLLPGTRAIVCCGRCWRRAHALSKPSSPTKTVVLGFMRHTPCKSICLHIIHPMPSTSRNASSTTVNASLARGCTHLSGCSLSASCR